MGYTNAKYFRGIDGKDGEIRDLEYKTLPDWMIVKNVTIDSDSTVNTVSIIIEFLDGSMDTITTTMSKTLNSERPTVDLFNISDIVRTAGNYVNDMLDIMIDDWYDEHSVTQRQFETAAKIPFGGVSTYKERLQLINKMMQYDEGTFVIPKPTTMTTTMTTTKNNK